MCSLVFSIGTMQYTNVGTIVRA